MREFKYRVKKMMCEGCENRIKSALMEIDGVTEVTANHKTEEVIVKTEKENNSQIKERISDLGYEIEEE